MDTARALPLQPRVKAFVARTAAKLTMLATLLLAGSGHAALIEISIRPSAAPLRPAESAAAGWNAVVDTSFLPRDDVSWGSARYAMADVAVDHAIGRRLDFGVHAAPGYRAFPPSSGLRDGLPMDPTSPDAWDTTVKNVGSVPDFWAILLVVAGLIAYQVRRKLRTGTVRIYSMGLGAGVVPRGAMRGPNDATASVAGDPR